MPKARRAGKRPAAGAGVGIDFKKVKRKVGRKLAPADNAVDTEVRARTLTLPSQSVAAERGGAAVAASRGLTLGELVAQLSHPAARVRGDALSGIAELAGAHPGTAARAAGPTLEALAERAGDADGGVRAKLAPAMVGVLKALASGGGGGGGNDGGACPSAATPFLPLLLAHARRAMTAVDGGVRRDALSLAGVILEACSGGGNGAATTAVVPPSDADAVLGAAAGLLAPGLRAASLAAGSLASLARTVSGVRRLLDAVVGEDDSAASAPPPPTSPPGQPLFVRRCGWPAAGVVAEGEGPAAASPTPPPAATSSPPPPPPLIAGLLQAWEECAPAALALARPATGRGDGGKRTVDGKGGGGVRPAKRGRGGAAVGGTTGTTATPTTATPALEAAPTCAADIVACLRTALRRRQGSDTTSTSTVAAVAAAVLARLPAPAPPAGSAAASHAPTLAALARLNVEGVRLLGEALPVLLAEDENGSTAAAAATASAWAAPLLALAASLLATGTALAPAADAAGGEAGPPGASAAAPPGAAAAALDAVERALPVLPADLAATLLSSVGALAARCPPTSPDRLAAVRAEARLLAGRRGNRVPDGVAAAWVRPLPRWLWECGPGRKDATAAGLAALHAAARAAVPVGALEAALIDVGDELATLLASAAVVEDKKKKKQQQTRRLLLGPLARLPPSTSSTPSAASLAVDLVEYLPSVRTPLMRAAALLTLCKMEGKSGPADRALGPRLVAAVARRARAGSGDTSGVDPAGFGGMILSLLTGCGAGQGAVGPPGWGVHGEAVHVGAAALVSAGEPGLAAAALEPSLLAAVDDAGASPVARAKAALGALATLGAAATGARAGGAGSPPRLTDALPRLFALYAAGGDPDDPGYPGLAPALAVLGQYASEAVLRDTLAALADAATGAAAVRGTALAAAALVADPALGPLAPRAALEGTMEALSRAAGSAADGGEAGVGVAAAAVRAFGAAIVSG